MKSIINYNYRLIHIIMIPISSVLSGAPPKNPWLHLAGEDKLSGDDQVAKQRNDVERLHQLQWVGNSWKYEVVTIYSASPIIPHSELMHKKEHRPINHQISAQNWHNWNNGLHQLFSVPAPAAVCNCGSVVVVVCCWCQVITAGPLPSQHHNNRAHYTL